MQKFFHTQNLTFLNEHCGKFNKPNQSVKFPEDMFEIMDYLKKAKTEFTLAKAIYKFGLMEYKTKNGVVIYRNY